MGRGADGGDVMKVNVNLEGNDFENRVKELLAKPGWGGSIPDYVRRCVMMQLSRDERSQREIERREAREETT